MNSEKFKIPEQQEGKALNLATDQSYSSRAVAEAAFQKARARLLAVNNWHQVAGGLMSARFVLCDAFAGAKNSDARVGDYVKIDIPGPGSIIGEGYDWARVTILEECADAIRMTLQPVAMPGKASNIPAHFFTLAASSTLTISLDGTRLIARYYGRNEQINLQHDHVLENLRSSAVGIAAKLGFSSPQWNKLIEGFVGE